MSCRDYVSVYIRIPPGGLLSRFVTCWYLLSQSALSTLLVCSSSVYLGVSKKTPPSLNSCLYLFCHHCSIWKHSSNCQSVKSRPCSALLSVLSIDFIVRMFVWVCASSEKLVCPTRLLGVFVYKCVWRRVPLPRAAWELWIPAIKSRPLLRPAAVRSGFPSAISLWVWYLPFPTLCAYSLAPRREQ